MMSEQRSAFTSIRIFSALLLLLLYTVFFPHNSPINVGIQSWEPNRTPCPSGTAAENNQGPFAEAGCSQHEAFWMHHCPGIPEP